MENDFNYELPCRTKFAKFNEHSSTRTFSLYKEQNQLIGQVTINGSNNGITRYNLLDILDFNEVEFKYEFNKYNKVILGNLEFGYRLTTEGTNLVEVTIFINGKDGNTDVSIEVGTTTRNILTRLQRITKMMIQDEFALSLLSKY